MLMQFVAPFKNIAADFDMSTIKLLRRLNENPQETLKFQLFRLDDLLTVTGDMRPVYWLVEKYCQDAKARQKQAVNDLIGIMPQLHELLKQAQIG